MGVVKKLFHWTRVWLNVLETGVILKTKVIVLQTVVSMIELLSSTVTEDWKEQTLGVPGHEK